MRREVRRKRRAELKASEVEDMKKKYDKRGE